MQEEQARISKAYERKVQELEKERQVMEEEKLQTGRYKQLLLKQRDIMVQLTTRLNERDQTILSLQADLEAYDQHQCLMEDLMDKKTAGIFLFSLYLLFCFLLNLLCVFVCAYFMPLWIILTDAFAPPLFSFCNLPHCRREQD